MTENSPWKTSREAADHFRISERTLCRWRQTGLIELGKHYRRKFPNANSPLLYSLALCDQAMNDACARDVRTLELVAEG
jgi:hypothetical protein